MAKKKSALIADETVQEPKKATEAGQKSEEGKKESRDVPGTGASEKTDRAPKLGEIMEVHAPNGLNMRQGPARSYSVKGRLDPGERVTLIALPEGLEVPDWSPVETLLGRGWVQTEFLRVVPQEGR